MSRLHFMVMSLVFAVRDFFRPPGEKLMEAGVRRLHRVLDYGCGPGGYTLAAARMVGEAGKVYARDINALAVQKVAKAAMRRGLRNVKTILSGCETGLDDGSVDVVLLYDVFHDLEEPDAILAELHRVVKPAGVLSFSDHHMREEDILSGVTRRGFFKLSAKGKRTYSLARSV